MEIRVERQSRPVADPVEAKIAIVRPILAALVSSLKGEVAEAAGYGADALTRGALPVHLLSRLWREGDGDVGIAFEYGVHDAIRVERADVAERVADALRYCRVPDGDPTSVYFAIEKKGADKFIDTQLGLITDQSRVRSGSRGRPILLRRHLKTLADAFRRPDARAALPPSINGLWKADLFLGAARPDLWVGTTVKTNRNQLEAAPGLTIGIVPCGSGRDDAVRRDDQHGLVLCPIPYDGGYMQTFYESWQIVRVLMTNDFRMPRDVDLPRPEDRQVAKVFVDRRHFGISDVLDATERFAQPHLLESNKVDVSEEPLNDAQPAISTLVAPIPLTNKDLRT